MLTGQRPDDCMCAVQRGRGQVPAGIQERCCHPCGCPGGRQGWWGAARAKGERATSQGRGTSRGPWPKASLSSGDSRGSQEGTQGERWGGTRLAALALTAEEVKHGLMGPEMPGLLDSTSDFLQTQDQAGWGQTSECAKTTPTLKAGSQWRSTG